MKKALVVGGNSGVGLAISLQLLERGYDHIYIVGKEDVSAHDVPQHVYTAFKEKTSFRRVNLINEEYGFLADIDDINTLVITAGFGRVALFEDLHEAEVANLVKCNLLSAIRIIKHYYHKICSRNDFFCAVMGSIAGHVVSPFFSVYGATKTGLCSFVESLNIELAKAGVNNRVLDVSPGSINGTNFSGGGNDIVAISALAQSIVEKMMCRETLYIPRFEDVYASVLQRYHDDPFAFGCESYDYKLKQGRVSDKPSLVVGYLSGTFDLFHIGHLNLLRRAKEQCDYLIVGVHKSGAWKGKETYIPYDERVEIVCNIKYVDKVIESFAEDSDAYDALHFHKLFVGSDYKGTERFLRYEEYFKDKDVEIVYFPYTQGTSSTQLRSAIESKVVKK